LIILTGFGAYGKYKSNLSGEIAKEFTSRYNKFQIEKAILPVSWKQSIDLYKRMLLKIKYNPDLVILLGIHSSKKYHLENYGWNLKMGEDIEGKFKIGLIKVYSHPWIKTMINLNNLLSAIKDNSSFNISNYAGSYLCNYLYYWALFLSRKKYPVIFIHIPAIDNLTEGTKKVELVLSAILKTHF
jgi:pyroglutamyl-peptidase